MLDAVDLRQTCHAGEAACDGKGDDIDMVGADTAQLGGVVVHAHGTDAVAQRRLIQQDPNGDGRYHGDNEAPVDASAVDQIGQVGVLGDGVGLQILGLGLLQRGAQQVVHKGADHIGGHHTDQKLVGAEFGFDKADETAGGAAGGEGGHQHQQDQHNGGQHIAQGEGQGNCHDTAHIELALCADVEEVGLIGKGESEGGKDKGRCLDENLAHVIAVAEDLAKSQADDLEGIDLHESQQQQADQQTDHHRSYIEKERVGTAFPFFHAVTSFSLLTPAISRPISSVVSSPLR